MCIDWDADGFPKSAPNPFKTVDTSEIEYCYFDDLIRKLILPHFTDISEDDVQKQLDKAEAAVQKSGRSVALHNTSATSFLVLGFELEESQ